MNTVREAFQNRKLNNNKIVTDYVRLKGSTTKRVQYIEASLYELLVDTIVMCIVTSDRQMITSEQLLEAIVSNPPITMNMGDLTWITLQVKNDLLFKKFLARSFQEYSQHLQLTPEGKIYFGLG